MFAHDRHDDNLDPRRFRRGVRARDFASMSRSVAIPRLSSLLGTLLARLGLTR